MTQSDKVSSQPITVVFSWTVIPGKEHLFEEVLHDIYKVAHTFPGHMGVTTLQSPTQKGNFQTILNFDSEDHLSAWLDSPIRHKMVALLGQIAHSETTIKATGLETWFELPGQTVKPPPRWKMVTTTFIAIYPLSLLYALYLAPHILHWPVGVRALFLPTIAPIVLTYLFMPFLTQRVLKRWLYKNG